MDHSMTKESYRKFGLMVALHFLAMYILMYAMVHSLPENVYNSFNQVYMALLMTSSMIAIEIAIMGSMYPNKKLNGGLILAGLVLLAASFSFIRTQAAIGDEQFVRSMIPHHSGAILMCRQASIKDPELQQLCGSIVSSQQSEIEQMKKILARLNK